MLDKNDNEREGECRSAVKQDGLEAAITQPGPNENIRITTVQGEVIFDTTQPGESNNEILES